MGHCFVSFSVNLTLILQLACAKIDDVGVHTIGGAVASIVDDIRVHIVSGVPSNPTPLWARCRSKDDDIGMHKLNNGESFSWKFSMNFFETTLFFCHFYWGSHTNIFTVFDRGLYEKCDHGTPHYDCFWVVRPDGFYFNNDNKSWEKMYDWS
ncbi:hypothetical protein Vadar_009236 [Vaccinium darrowii]|uniref:Uncharacterized protein n=1 Tax=Vaccinium darrowii TaxID=229202 RepID=A0ACB7WZ86_9ERIC|nr:hypothetical protein Vadar_009236 [Vaccinium darrowii]